ncbi:MAG TPA: hypothetical protein PLW78_10245 [bacterium]|nr:hypothetical protein [bacterium]HRQ70666.1 hypothetical protein [bacterium]
MCENSRKDLVSLLPVTSFEKEFNAKINPGWLVISYRWASEDTKSERRRKYGRWYEIKSENGRIFRVMSFSGSIEGNYVNEKKCFIGDIVVDWAGWIELTGYSGEEKKQIEVQIRQIRKWQYILCAFSHPDPNYRLSALLGLLSLFLGLLSLVFAIIPFIKI